MLGFHEGFAVLPGGFLGVDLFFVISGYLITDLLAAPWDLGGRLDLRGFWIRRARRLLPCLAVVLVTVTAAVAVFAPDQLAGLRPALLAAVTYTSNWWQGLHQQSYFSVFGPPPPLQHLWSLAIEEQFYLIWPAVLTVIICTLRSRRARVAAIWAGAAASATAMTVGYALGANPSRLYYATDTHATALLLGAGLALGWPLRKVAAASVDDTRRWDLIGRAGLVVLAAELLFVSGGGGSAYLGGIALAAVAGGAVVVAAAGPGMVSRMLGRAPLRWVGVRSYGIYLWHWPVIALLEARAGTNATGLGIRVVETALPIALAAASWRWIEAPILRDGLGVTVRGWRAALEPVVRGARRSPGEALPALIPVAAAVVAATAVFGVFYSPSGPTLQQQLAAGIRVSAASARDHSRPLTIAKLRHYVAPQSPGSLLHPGSGQPSLLEPAWLGKRSTRRNALLRPVSARHPGRDVTAIGDSVMLAAAPELHAALPGSFINAQVSRQMSQGIALARRLASGGRLGPIVVVGLGTNGPITMGQVQALRAVAGPRRALVLVNTFVPRPWQAGVNAVLTTASRRYPDVTLANWLATIRNRTGLLWGDGVHPRPAGAVAYARMLTAAVRSAAVRLEAAAKASKPAPPASPRPAPAWNKLGP